MMQLPLYPCFWPCRFVALHCPPNSSDLYAPWTFHLNLFHVCDLKLWSFSLTYSAFNHLFCLFPLLGSCFVLVWGMHQNHQWTWKIESSGLHLWSRGSLECEFVHLQKRPRWCVYVCALVLSLLVNPVISLSSLSLLVWLHVVWMLTRTPTWTAFLRSVPSLG